MRFKVVVLFLVIVIAICLCGVAANCEDTNCNKGSGMADKEEMRPGGGPGGGMGMRDKMMDDLNLTQEQKDKIKEIKAQCEISSKYLREELRKNNEELDTLWKADNPDATAIKAKTAQGNDIRAKLQNQMVDDQLKVFSILTPEQRAKVRPHMNMMMEPGMGMGMMGPGMRDDMVRPGMGGRKKPNMKQRPGMGKMKGMKPGMCCPRCGTCPMCNKKIKPAVKKAKPIKPNNY